jgi:hypothetical protein
MAIVRYERKPGDPLTRRQKENLKRIAEIKDEDIDFLVGQTIALCGLFGGGLRPAKFHEKRLDIAACQNGKAAQ